MAFTSVPIYDFDVPTIDNTTPQTKYQDNQTILDLDINDLYNNFIVSIDNTRSYCNPLVKDNSQLNMAQYQESRINTYYRMIGFPIVEPNGSYYSPGHDPSANSDQSVLNTNGQIATKLQGSILISQSLNPREAIFKNYAAIFNQGGIAAKAITLGSLYIRSFDKQFGQNIPPLENDLQVQTLKDRIYQINNFYGSDAITAAGSYLYSVHPLKPFIVDPRFDNTIKPTRNRICAPFLKDKSQTKLFGFQNGSADNLQRPYIERVISIRFNNSNVVLSNTGSNVVSTITNQIKSDKTITNPSLINLAANPLGNLHNDELTIFSNYINILRAIIKLLSDSINDAQKVRKIINFQPIPDPKQGIEVGGTIDVVTANDNNNLSIEKDILNNTIGKYQSDLSTAMDFGLQGAPDVGDFAFSGLDDLVFNINKNVSASFDETIQTLTDKRNRHGADGIAALQTIEIIMGEFSGIGLIDIVAIQAALWIMDPASLVTLIDARAFARLKLRKDLNVNVNQIDIIAALTNFELNIKIVYQLIQSFFDGITNGTTFSKF